MHEKLFVRFLVEAEVSCYDSDNKGRLDKKQDAYVILHRLVTRIVDRFKCRSGACTVGELKAIEDLRRWFRFFMLKLLSSLYIFHL